MTSAGRRELRDVGEDSGQNPEPARARDGHQCRAAWQRRTGRALRRRQDHHPDRAPAGSGRCDPPGRTDADGNIVSDADPVEIGQQRSAFAAERGHPDHDADERTAVLLSSVLTPIGSAVTGDFCAVARLASAETGDTLSEQRRRW